MPAPAEFEQRIQRIEALLETFERATDPHLRDSAKELVQSLMDLHGAGIERMLTIVQGANGASFPLMQQFAKDDLVASLLLLYDLHPEPIAARVQEGLKKASPYLESHGGNVELLSIDEEGAVRLRLHGTCHSCPSSSVTLKLVIEEAIREAAPEVTAVIVEGEPETTETTAPAPLVQLRSNSSSQRRADGMRETAATGGR